MIKGDNVTKEYYKNPEATAKALEPDGWLHTGDLGYMDNDGFVFVTGRLKELIIKGGENIAPREIDEALYRHPAVLDAAAVEFRTTNTEKKYLPASALSPGKPAPKGNCSPIARRISENSRRPRRSYSWRIYRKDRQERFSVSSCRNCVATNAETRGSETISTPGPAIRNGLGCTPIREGEPSWLNSFIISPTPSPPSICWC